MAPITIPRGMAFYCKECGSPKALHATRLCNNCWEITHRLSLLIQENPKAAIRLLERFLHQAMRIDYRTSFPELSGMANK